MFREYLENNDLSWLINPPVYRKVLPKNSYNVYCVVRNSIKNGDKIYVHPDPDIDGFLSAKCWQYTFNKLGYNNFKIGLLENRRHKVKYSTIEKQIKDGCKLIILVDSSTNEMDMIRKVCENDVKLIIIDHHNSNNTFSMYPNNCTIINPKFENPNLPMYSVSAGVVNALVCDYVLNMYNKTDNEELEYYGYITMYSDVCSPKNPYIASYMRRKLHKDGDVPELIRFFWDNYSSMTKRFISFKVNPLINAAIRMGEFTNVHKLFFELESLDSVDRKELMDSLIRAKERSIIVVDELESLANVMESTDLVMCVIPPNLEEFKYNFLGYLASRYAERYDKTAICIYLDHNTDSYVGSARDSRNRDLLSEFSAFFEGSEGHDSAFGVVIDRRKLNQLPDILRQANIEETKQEVIFDYLSLSSDKEIQNMAIYNELSIHDIPKAKVKINLTGDFNISGSSKRLVARTKTLSIVSFGMPLIRNSTLLCVPEFNGTQVECVVEKVL